MKKFSLLVFSVLFMFSSSFTNAQKKRGQKKQESKTTNRIDLSAFKFRNIGPAFLSGRIADIAIHPNKENTWYVAVGSGGLWKTENAGTTWTPLFDKQSSYSTGCVTIDNNNPSTIWLGTGENVGGRHVGIGKGVFQSKDGGKTWKNKGLNKTPNIYQKLLFIQKTQTSFGLHLKDHYGVMEEKEDYIKQLMEDNLGIKY